MTKLFPLQVVMVQKAIAFCGSTPENFAKVMMIENQLSKRGAQSRHIADALKKLAGFDKRAEIVEKLKKTVVEEKVSFMKIYNAIILQLKNWLVKTIPAISLLIPI